MQLSADPARVWVFVADLHNLPQWTAASRIEAAPDVAKAGDKLSAIHRRLGLLPYRVQYEVRDWEAGRWFRLCMSGLPFIQDAEFICRMESVVEPGGPVTSVALQLNGTANPWLVGPIESMAQRRVAFALRKLRKAVR